MSEGQGEVLCISLNGESLWLRDFGFSINKIDKRSHLLTIFFLTGIVEFESVVYPCVDTDILHKSKIKNPTPQKLCFSSPPRKRGGVGGGVL
jgi:hypothetical protein